MDEFYVYVTDSSRREGMADLPTIISLAPRRIFYAATAPSYVVESVQPVFAIADEVMISRILHEHHQLLDFGAK